MNVILFESYFTPLQNDRAFDKFDWPSADFPEEFSRLIAVRGSQMMDIPATFRFPSNPMFVDINTFSIDDTRPGRKIRFSRNNNITVVHYKLGVTFRRSDEYEIALEGSHERIKFRDIIVQAPSDRTEMIRIRLSANRTLFAALTFLQAANESSRGWIGPKSISHPAPDYPAGTRTKKWGGNVRILCTISPQGRVASGDYVLLECPHTLFARDSIAMVLSQWTFEPATRSGVPVSSRAVLNVPFSYFSMRTGITRFPSSISRWDAPDLLQVFTYATKP